MKKCPFCAEQIQDEAVVCRYCGRDLPIAPKPPVIASAIQPKKKGGLCGPLTLISAAAMSGVVVACAILVALVASPDTPGASATSAAQETNAAAVEESVVEALQTTFPDQRTRTPFPTRPTEAPRPTSSVRATPSHRFVKLSGHMFEGAQVYYGLEATKAYGFKLVGKDDNCATMPNGYGLLVEYPDGHQEWKDYIAIGTGEIYFVYADDPALKARVDLKPYSGCD